MPVVVTRDADGRLNAFENRCAHRGSLLCINERGEARDITCVYHNWSYDLAGNLTGVAFRKGMGGKGGMPPDAKPDENPPRKLRVETIGGIIFGTLSDETPPLEGYLGPEIAKGIRRVMRAPVRVLGGYSQMLNSNWKLYMENVKDSYHASLLHTFFTTFRLNRLSQKGGLVISETGGNHISYSLAADTGGKEYEQAGLRAAQEGFGLEAPEMLRHVDEYGDGVGLQILSVSPTFVLQQTRNSLAVRRLVTHGIERTELVWTIFGFVDDDEAMTERRLLQANLIGPAGYISMEDGAAPGFVQRGDQHRAGCPLGGGDGRPRDQVRGYTRHGSVSARLLDLLPRADGALNSWTSRPRSRCRTCLPATSRRSTTTGWKLGRISSPSNAAISSPPPTIFRRACRSA